MAQRYAFLQSLGLIPLLLAACGDGEAAMPSPAMSSPAMSSAMEPASGDPPVISDRRLSAIGLQLYTVRAALEQDFEGTLRRVAELGYTEVELAGLFGRAPEEVRQLLAELNLTAVGSHVTWDRFRSDSDGAIEETLALGCQYLVFPWMPDAERQTLAQWRDWVALLNQVARASSDRGLEFAYHNHDFEFAEIEGVRPYDLLLDELDRDTVTFELDLYWLARSGNEPGALFERFPGGFPLVHVKDMRNSDQAIVDVGEGDLDFASVFAQAERAGMQHFIVEHDEPADPLLTAEKSATYLKQLSF